MKLLRHRPFARTNDHRATSARTWFASLAAILTLGLATGCQLPGGAGMDPAISAAQTEVTLNPGDVVRFTFVGSPEMTQSQKIRTDGMVSLPMAGEVLAAGKTVVGLQAELATLYKSQLQYAQVVVSLDEGGMPVTVSGAVKSPGPHVYERPTTLFEAIEDAGDFSDYAAKDKVHVVRIVNGRQQTYIVDLTGTLNGKATAPFYVRGGDVVYVPTRFFTF